MTRASKDLLVMIVTAALVLFLFTVPAIAGQINFSFENASYRDVFQTLGEFAGLNVVVDPEVSGTISITLRDISLEQALDVVAVQGNWAYRIRDSILFVASSQRLEAMEQQDVRFYTVRFASPRSVRDALGAVMDTGTMYMDDESRLLMLQAPEHVLRRAEEVLVQIDLPRHVAIDASERNLLEIFSQLTEELKLNLIADPRLRDITLGVSFRQMAPFDLIEKIEELTDITVEVARQTMIVMRKDDAPEPEPVVSERVKIYRLQHADPGTVATMLGLIISGDQIQSDQETSSIVIRATDALLAEADEIVAEFDQVPKQVLLEVWVHEITLDARHKLGIEWQGVPDFRLPSAPTFLQLDWEPWELILALKALEDQGEAKLLANPRIATISGQQARVFVGDRVPVVLGDVDGADRIETFEAGVDLVVIPRVSDDGYVTIDVRPQISSFSWLPGVDFPRTRTREAQTTVRTKDGQPIIIGGLVQEEESESIARVPFISDLPILGQLFQWRETTTRQTEMNIFIIPHIIDGSKGVVPHSFFPPAQ